MAKIEGPVQEFEYVRIEDRNHNGVVDADDKILLSDSHGHHQEFSVGDKSAVDFLNRIGASDITGQPMGRAALYLSVLNSLRSAEARRLSGNPGDVAALYGEITTATQDARLLVQQGGPNLRADVFRRCSAALNDNINNAMNRADDAVRKGRREEALRWLDLAQTQAQFSQNAGYDVSIDGFRSRMDSIRTGAIGLAQRDG